MAVKIKCEKLFPIGSCSFNWEIERFHRFQLYNEKKEYRSEPFYIHKLIPTQFCLSARFIGFGSNCVWRFYLVKFQKYDVILRNWKFNFSITIHTTSNKYAELINEDYNAYGCMLSAVIGFPLFTVFIKEGSMHVLGKMIPFKDYYLKLKCNFKLFSNDSAAFPSTVSPSSEEKKMTICSDLKNLYGSKDLSDITISIGKDRLKAHQLILMARSPVFKAMLSSNFQESKTRHIKIIDVDTRTFDCFLKYLYCGEIDEVNFDAAYSLYKIADKYDVVDLKQECRDFLEVNITKETVSDILEFADFYEDLSLKEKAVEFLKNDFSVLTIKKWRNLCQKNPELASEILHLLTPDCE